MLSVFFLSCGNGPKVNVGNPMKAYYDSINAANEAAEKAPPVEIEFSKALDKTYDNKRVTMDGYLMLPSTSYQTAGTAQLAFLERKGQFDYPFYFIVSIPVGDGKNTMKSLPDGYLKTDVKITGEGGEMLTIGDHVRLTGKLSVMSESASMNVEKIEKSPKAETDYAALNATELTESNAKDPALEGKLVWAQGTLDIPSLTMGGTYTFFYLNVKGMNDHVTIDIPYGEEPNHLAPLPDNYKNSDIKLHDKNGDVVGNKVKVYGLWKNESIKVECIEKM